jgi:transcriptional regulator with GAF, ATPase, and Fis domain
MATSRTLLSRTFVQLADSLVDEFDIIELLTLLSHRCVELFDAGAAGILLGDQRGTLQVVAASTEQARLLELFQLQNDEGPCLECFSSGARVLSGDLAFDEKWPLFGAEALELGFHAVQAFPLRLRAVVIGTLNIFMESPVSIGAEDLELCQALADVATIAILQNQAAKEAQNINGQLQRALDSRITIEQAKGVLAERVQVDMTEAFALLRRYARDNNRALSQVAAEVVTGKLAASALVTERPSAGSVSKPDVA